MTFPFATTGPEKPCPTAFCHSTGGPSFGHALAMFVSVVTPFRFGPRNCGQSAAAHCINDTTMVATDVRRLLTLCSRGCEPAVPPPFVIPLLCAAIGAQLSGNARFRRVVFFYEPVHPAGHELTCAG